jgi:GGDEF domain-containing protein
LKFVSNYFAVYDGKFVLGAESKEWFEIKSYAFIVLAYGYAFYNKNESESIYSTFSKADKAMYIYKAKLKKFYGKRQNY